MGWHEHVDGVFHGCEKFFRPGYAANLVNSWIPALHDVKQKLEAGARVADVGCGKGTSTILMAKAFPKSQFFGFDYHDKSIEAARESATRNGVADRVTFAVSNAKQFPGKDYDFVAVFDCLHDMGDPIGAAAHVRQSLAKDRTWMIVEPFANDQLKDNLNPVGGLLLLLLYPAVYTLLAIAGSWIMLGCSSWRDTHPGRCDLGRVQSLSPSNGNTPQHRLRSSAMICWRAIRGVWTR
jgi:SAM-dependent methyltransferase